MKINTKEYKYICDIAVIKALLWIRVWLNVSCIASPLTKAKSVMNVMERDAHLGAYEPNITIPKKPQPMNRGRVLAINCKTRSVVRFSGRERPHSRSYPQ